MSRWLVLLLALAMMALGVVFSAINPDRVTLDLYWFTVNPPAGVLVLASVLLGVLLGGGFLYAGVIVPLRMRLRAQRRVAERSVADRAAAERAAAERTGA